MVPAMQIFAMLNTRPGMGKNTSKCILIQNTKYPSNKCIKIKYKILVPEHFAFKI